LESSSEERVDGWLVSFPGQSYGDGGPAEMGGPVPVALVGHEDMDDAAFRDFVSTLYQSTHRRQVSEPAGFQAPSSQGDSGHTMIDLRRVTQAGDLSPVAKRRCPELCKHATSMVSVLDRVAPFPMATGILDDYRRSKDSFRMSEVMSYMADLLSKMREPASRQSTIGDTIGHVPDTNHYRL